MQLKTIDYETAKLAKEVGFEKKWCDVAYREDDKKLYMDTGMYTDYPAPTQELLRKWLLKEWSFFVNVDTEWIGSDEWVYKYILKWIPKENWDDNRRISAQKIVESYFEAGGSYSGGWGTYEEALEAGLKEALKYLLNQKSES